MSTTRLTTTYPTAATSTTPCRSGVVALVDRVDRQTAEAGDDEDLLGDHSAGDECTELQPDHGHYRDQAVAQCVLADDRPLGEALRARRADVVRAEGAEHRRAHLTHQYRRKARAEDDRGHQHVLEVLHRVLREGHVAAGGQPLELHGEVDDHHDAEPEMRHREPDERDRRGGVVRRLAPPHRRKDAGNDADHRPDQDREACELERDRQPLHDRVRYRQLALVGAEVTPYRETRPVEVLDRQWPVEAVLVADRRDQGRVPVLRAERGRRIAGDRSHTCEDEHAREHNDDQGSSDLAQEEAAHDRPYSSATS